MEEVADIVYQSILGLLIKELRLTWVENEFVPGKPYHTNYNAMHDAYECLRDRLGVEDEDDDVEDIIRALLDNEELLCKKMFYYGTIYREHMPETSQKLSIYHRKTPLK